MPSKTPKQARFMRAVAHGWKPSRTDAPPVSVAKEFVEADKKYSGGFAENRYGRGGLAAMGSVDSGSERQRPLQQLGWEEGGDVNYEVEPGVYEAPNVEEMGPALNQMFDDMAQRRSDEQSGVIDYAWDKTTSDPEKRTNIDDKLAEMSGPEQVEYVKPRLLSAMRKMKDIGESQVFKDYSMADYMDVRHQVHLWRSLWTKALQQQAREAEGEEKGMRRGGRVIPLDGGIGGGMRRAALGAQGYQYDPVANVMREPEPTIEGVSGTSVTGPSGNPVTTYSGPRMAGAGRAAGRRRGAGRRDGGGPRGGGGPGPGGGPGGPGTAPPRIIPTDPAAYVGASSDRSGRGSEYRKQLRQHQAKVAATLGSARGGHVNYYQEGGAVRPGHAEGPNPHEAGTAAWKYWERRFHKEPPPPPEPEAAAEEVPWWKKLMGYEAAPTRTAEELEAIGEARGGRINYQAGGLAIAAPAGGVPPWIEPTGMEEEPVGYQFGGGVPYRGIPPQRRPMQPRGRSPFSRRFQRRQAPVGGAPQRGGLAAMMQQAQQQRAGVSDRYPPGYNNEAGIAQGPVMNLPAPGPDDVVYDRDWPPRGPMAPGGSPLDVRAAKMRAMTDRFAQPTGGGSFAPGEGIPGGGNIPPWKQPPGSRIAPPPGKDMGGSGPIQGGPRVPPNMQGYLQKMRMQNRPPSGPVGGGGNRVGMQDQQGAFARAMQRGTGRAPTSRRMAFGRAGPTQ